MILVSGTDPARAANQLTAAFELYQGGCLPQLRARLGDRPQHRSRVRVLSAAHGVLHADTQLLPDLPMTEQRSKQLRPLVRDKLRAEFARDGVPRQVIVLAESLYTDLITDIFWIPDLRPYTTLHTSAPSRHWSQAQTALDKVGWP